MITKIETPCPHCGRESLEVWGAEDDVCALQCTWMECKYHIPRVGNLEETIRFANRRIDKEKTRILNLLRDALYIIETGEITPHARTVSEKSVSLFKHKCEEFYGENGKYNARKQ